MPRDNALIAEQGRTGGGQVFTVERANRALVYVRRVVADLVARYRELTELRARQNAAEAATGDDPDTSAAQEQLDRCVRALSALHRELLEVGCVLKDWRTGLIDFPAVYDGRRVWLCWKLGEPAVTHWHELNDGFAGRRRVGTDFV